MSKKINLAMPEKNIEKWIEEGKDKKNNIKDNTNSVKMKRLTIDITENLHSQIKIYCAKKGVNMADEIRHLLEIKFQ